MIKNADGRNVGRLVEGDAEDLAGYPIGDNGEILDDDGDLVGRCELTPEMAEEQANEAAGEAGNKMPNISVLKGLTADRSGQILNEDGDFVGHLVEGDPSAIQGKELDLRVSTVPTAHGESVVMRLLDREAVDFDSLKPRGFKILLEILARTDLRIVFEQS